MGISFSGLYRVDFICSERERCRRGNLYEIVCRIIALGLLRHFFVIVGVRSIVVIVRIRRSFAEGFNELVKLSFEILNRERRSRLCIEHRNFGTLFFSIPGCMCECAEVRRRQIVEKTRIGFFFLSRSCCTGILMLAGLVRVSREPRSRKVFGRRIGRNVKIFRTEHFFTHRF